MQRRQALIALVGASTFALNACATVDDDRRRDRDRDRRADQRGDRDGGRWDELGRLDVDFKRERDVLDVGKDDGKFRRLRIVVRGASIELYDVKVVFENNSVFDPKVRRQIDENSAIEFDLPGERRAIKRISFLYRAPQRREGKATVIVQGRH
jgi:hypothetical protein